MPATAATSGFSTVIKKGATAIAEVAGITGPGISRNAIDATHLNSPSQAKEFIAGLIDAGEVSLDLNWLPSDATHAALFNDLMAGTKDTYSIVWPNAGPTTWTFTALVTAFSPTAPKDDRLSASATLKLSGTISIT